MSKLKHIVIVISALFVMSIASVSLASTNCSTTISQSTATCLSNAADSAFQSDYATKYAKQKSGVGSSNSFAQQPNSGNPAAAAPRSSVVLPQPQQKQSTADTANTNNNSTKQPVHWF